MSLYHIAQQIEASPPGQLVRESTWLFPAIEATHLVAIAMLGGAVFILALAVLGVGLKTPPAQVELSARPYLNISVIALLLTGVFLGVSEPVKLLDRESFWVKMTALAAAIPFTYLVFIPLVRRTGATLLSRASAVVVIGLWLTVAIAGRWIGFS
ncbi:MAG: DUF6644 family protein [Caulobacterales bacterium]